MRNNHWLYRSLAIIMLTVMLLCSVSCSKTTNESEEIPKEKTSKIQIGMSFDSFVIERWQRDRDVFVSTAKELGAEVNVQNANGDIQKQREQIDYFIEKGMDVIVVVCIDSDGLGSAIEKAKNAGIKVIAYDRLVNNSNVDLYITFDNEMVGTLMGNALAEQGIEGGKVLMLGGSLTDNNVAMVETGFTNVMKKIGVTIVDSMHCDGWRAELAADYVYEHPEIIAQVDAIMCGNDNVAAMTIRALAENRLAGTKLVVGQDADLDACQRIVEGTQLVTVYKPFEKLAKRAAQAAISLATNGTVDGSDVSTVNDGKYLIKYIGLEPILVTKDNMNEVIIGSGFHLKEDVYLNVPEMMP